MSKQPSPVALEVGFEVGKGVGVGGALVSDAHSHRLGVGAAVGGVSRAGPVGFTVYLLQE